MTKIIGTVHEEVKRHIVFGDVTPKNVLVKVLKARGHTLICKVLRAGQESPANVNVGDEIIAVNNIFYLSEDDGSDIGVIHGNNILGTVAVLEQGASISDAEDAEADLDTTLP